MAAAESGDTAKVHDTGKLEDRTVFDTSREREPISFTLEGCNLIHGFDQGIQGMLPGENKTIRLLPADGYSERKDELIGEVARDHFPENIRPKAGAQFQAQRSDGQPVSVTVIKAKEDILTIDAVSPLADRTLIFEVELVAIG